MWKEQKLKLSPQAKKTLDDAQKGIISPFSLSVSGTKIGVHNWTHGIEEKSNRYLSPENAVKALAAKLIDYGDPNRPRGMQDVIAIMVTSPNIEQFIVDLDKVRVLLPEPCFKQAYDYAKSSKDLQQTKMTKTPTIASPAFGNGADITPGSGRIMQSVLRNAIAGANAIKTGDPSAVIKNLLKMKAEREAENKKQVDTLLKTVVTVQAFSASDLLEIAETKIKINVPSAQNVFTACVMYVGSDLSAIRGMLND
ncbi:hypothetical protein HYE54_03680 [Aggregatibacter actinomycetemcomitans]|uniref:hypothetical protein n=1 Tax=Aggregatibacter actinomycetemcomitans TaxID=714 RepID=UPI00197C8250|nr:hypothetical protein [Aggregatibacter actinomycetemcomitans]MBN6067884.1 hypothetical protein [Aggregatibacter actinomycetemcomitans]MBN6085821.1 hypothetical protein [Aggregatibacter actinomycetemcomitans]